MHFQKKLNRKGGAICWRNKFPFFSCRGHVGGGALSSSPIDLQPRSSSSSQVSQLSQALSFSWESDQEGPRRLWRGGVYIVHCTLYKSTGTIDLHSTTIKPARWVSWVKLTVGENFDRLFPWINPYINLHPTSSGPGELGRVGWVKVWLNVISIMCLEAWS